MKHRGSLLILTFSPIAGDARVLKQIQRLSAEWDVTTCGYGPAPSGVVAHIRIPDDRRVDDPDRILLSQQRYDTAYWRLGGVRWARSRLGRRRHDVVVANDVEAVPLALRLRPRQGVHADLHEYSPRLHDDNLLWRSRMKPFLEWLVRRYVVRAGSWSTVSGGLAGEYEREFGFRAELVTNATPFAELSPSPVGVPIRLVHSGACLRNRGLLAMAEAVESAAVDVTLDFYLTPNHPDHLEELKGFAAASRRVRVHDPVPYERLVETLNGYDVGLFVLPPVTFNYRWALPNKLFDFVQARLGVVVGPSAEMAEYVRGFGFGEVADGFSVDATREAIERLTPERVAEFKSAADASARELSSETQVEIWARQIRDLAAGRGAPRPVARGAESEGPRRRLVLLTNEYPLDRGDATFIANEIDALARAYDEVLVFNYPSDGEWRFGAVPAGVEYGGSLKEGTRAELIRRLLTPTTAWLWGRAVLTELRHGRVGRRVKPVLITTAAAALRGAHPRLKRALRERGWTTSVYAFWAMGAGSAVACLPRIGGRTAVRLHRYDLYEDIIGWLPLRGSLLTRPDVLLPISEHGAAYLRARYPWRDRAPVVVARLGTTDHGVGTRPDGQSPLTVASCSAVTAVKRVDLLMRALHTLSLSRPVRWVHFGAGPLAERLQAESARLADDRFQIELRGQTSNADIMAFYLKDQVQVFVNVSESEGVPVSIMEAMSAGIPVVATDVGGVAEIVGADLGSGELVHRDSTAEDIASAVERVADAEDLDPRGVWQHLSNAEVNVQKLLVELEA